MAHAMITVAVPIANQVSVHDLRRQVADLGNLPRADVKSAFEATDCIHFASLNVVPGGKGQPGYLVFEVSGDGTEKNIIAALDTHASQVLLPVLRAAFGEAKGDSLTGILKDHKLRVGTGPRSAPGICHAGTPGLSLKRIRAERILEQHVRQQLGTAPNDLHALTVLSGIRDRLKANPDFAWVFDAGETPHLCPDRGIGEAVAGLLFKSNLTPWLAATLFGLVFFFFYYSSSVSDGSILRVLFNPSAAWNFLTELWNRSYSYVTTDPFFAFAALVKNLVFALLCVLAVVAAVLWFLYSRLRRHEKADKPRDLDPDPDVVSAIMARARTLPPKTICSRYRP